LCRVHHREALATNAPGGLLPHRSHQNCAQALERDAREREPGAARPAISADMLAVEINIYTIEDCAVGKTKPKSSTFPKGGGSKGKPALGAGTTAGRRVGEKISLGICGRRHDAHSSLSPSLLPRIDQRAVSAPMRCIAHSRLLDAIRA